MEEQVSVAAGACRARSAEEGSGMRNTNGAEAAVHDTQQQELVASSDAADGTSTTARRLLAALRHDCLEIVWNQQCVCDVGVQVNRALLSWLPSRSVLIMLCVQELAAVLDGDVTTTLQLRRLELCSNKLSCLAMESLTPLLRRCGHLRTLSLYRNRLGDAGVAALCDAASQSLRHCLLSLDIGYNRVSATGAVHLAEFLSEPNSLRCLAMGWNRCGMSYAFRRAR